MAIPDWTWQADADDLGGGSVGSIALEPVSDALGTLSNRTRLEILLALAREASPRSYSSLMAATGVEDKGRFNYHVRRLRGEFLRKTDDGYVLTDAGRAFVRTVLTESGLLVESRD